MNGLSIIVPCYNEASRGDFKNRIKQLAKRKEELSFPCEIVYVNDGSKDKTLSLLKNQKVFSLLENRGKYIALQYGIALCQYDTVLMLDADLEISSSDISNAYNHLDKYQIVVGYRTETDNTFFRRVLSKVAKFVSKNIFKISATDTQCGYKMFKKEVYGKIKSNIVCHKYLWDMNFLLEAQKRNIPIMEVPISAKGIKESTFKTKTMYWGSLKEFMTIKSQLNKR